MQQLKSSLQVIIILLIAFGCILNIGQPLLADTITVAPYQERTIHSPVDIGKCYMGREIAKVMGHTGASWLERSSRDQEQPQRIISALDLKPTDTVADRGAGTGYISLATIPYKLPHTLLCGTTLDCLLCRSAGY